MSSSSRTVSVAYLAYDCAETFRLSQPELSREKYISYAASLSAARILFIAKYFFFCLWLFSTNSNAREILLWNVEEKEINEHVEEKN